MAKWIGVTPQRVVLLTAAYLFLALNTPFISGLFSAAGTDSVADVLFAVAAVVVLLSGYVGLLTLFNAPYLLRPTVIVTLLITAGATYFTREYGIVIDENMFRNAIETNQTEVRDLVTLKLVSSFVLLGLLPALAVALVPIAWPPMRVLVRQNIKRGLASLAIAAVAFGLFFAPMLSFFREHKDLLHKLAPSNTVTAGIRFLKPHFAHARAPVALLGADARKGDHWSRTERPTVVVLVVGETARASNFALNGYSKPTTPELAKVPSLLNFTNVTSCGTDTAVSVPCMFSGLSRDKFSYEAAASRENVLDIARHAGLDVLWRENQSGCKGVCSRIATEKLTTANNPAFCADGECHDEILVHGLKDKLRQMRDGGVVVLHMMGSHGPAYFKRYPAAFAAFQPACETAQFGHCTNEQITNAYDNTIRYTDFVLSKVIAELTALADEGFDTAMLYASDHGESLGEKGLYLHGMPYSIAPDGQTHIPMVMWLSPQYRENFAIDQPCLAQRASQKWSHDNIFHTLLGMLDIETRAADTAQDILDGCRGPALATIKQPAAHP